MTPYLTDAELAEICPPHTQGAAQIRLLRRWRIKVERKPNGRPLVWRVDVERREAAETRDNVRASNEPNWGKRA